jgi:hypothetical protein
MSTPWHSSPLMRPSRDDVRDHVHSRKGDQCGWYQSYRGFQRQTQPKMIFAGFFDVCPFSSFSTI